MTRGLKASVSSNVLSVYLELYKALNNKYCGYISTIVKK